MHCPVIELTQELIRCPSISPNDAECQTILINRLKKIGFNIEIMNKADTKNFWAWHGKDLKSETLAFAGHTDVVPVGDIKRWINKAPFEPMIRNGMLFGRGSADMKGALAAMIVAAERFIIRYPSHKGRLAFIITSDEEGSAANGTVNVVENLIQRNERLDYCLVGEPSSNKVLGDVIKNGRRGSITANLHLRGIEGHVAYPQLADNPIHKILPILNKLIVTEWDYGNKYFPPTSIQITNIQSGIGSNNMIPEQCFIQFNFRFSSELTYELIKERVLSLLNSFQLSYRIEWQLSAQPFLTAEGKLLDSVINSIKKLNNIQPHLLTTGGTSDGRFISKMGAQVVELGLVNNSIHKTNECVKITDLSLLSLMYEHIMNELLMVI